MPDVELKGLNVKEGEKVPIALPISPNQDYCQGEDLNNIVLAIISSSKISSVKVIVGDSLQRHNYLALGMSEAEALERAQKDGEKWYKNSHKILEKLAEAKIPYKIHYWDSLLLSPQSQLLAKEGKLDPQSRSKPDFLSDDYKKVRAVHDLSLSPKPDSSLNQDQMLVKANIDVIASKRLDIELTEFSNKLTNIAVNLCKEIFLSVGKDNLPPKMLETDSAMMRVIEAVIQQFMKNDFYTYSETNPETKHQCLNPQAFQVLKSKFDEAMGRQYYNYSLTKQWQTIVEQSITMFIKDYNIKPKPTFNSAQILNCTKDYVTEELAVFELFSCEYFIYPFSRSPISNKIYECMKILIKNKLKLVDARFDFQAKNSKKSKKEKKQFLNNRESSKESDTSGSGNENNNSNPKVTTSSLIIRQLADSSSKNPFPKSTASQSIMPDASQFGSEKLTTNDESSQLNRMSSSSQTDGDRPLLKAFGRTRSSSDPTKPHTPSEGETPKERAVQPSIQQHDSAMEIPDSNLQKPKKTYDIRSPQFQYYSRSAPNIGDYAKNLQTRKTAEQNTEQQAMKLIVGAIRDIYPREEHASLFADVAFNLLARRQEAGLDNLTRDQNKGNKDQAVPFVTSTVPEVPPFSALPKNTKS